jgi:general secretion pathway protein G
VTGRLILLPVRCPLFEGCLGTRVEHPQGMTQPPPVRRELSRALEQALLAAGYSLICLVVVSVLAFLLGVFTVTFSEPCSRRDRGRLDLRNILMAAELHRVKTGRYPTTQEGLRPLVDRQMLESLPLDPWGSEYHYSLRKGQPRVWSLGADGAPGGEGSDADIVMTGPLRAAAHRP